MRIDLLAVGGMDDHVHLLVRLPSTISIADAVKQLKGSSSHFANHEVEKSAAFRWQGSYGAFSVSERILPRVRRYIANQEQHHRNRTLHRAYELG
jgi:REP element-mobilizing transposase RayT